MMPTLTSAEAAQRLGVTRQQVALLCRRGRLRATKRGRDWEVNAESVKRYAATKSKGGRPKKEECDAG